MRASVPLPSFATQTAFGVAAAPQGCTPVAIRADGCGTASRSDRATSDCASTLLIYFRAGLKVPRGRRIKRMATTSELLSLDDVHRARERIAGRLHRTPMLTSRTLAEPTGADIRFKA